MDDSPLEYSSTVIVIWMIGCLDEDEIETDVQEWETKSIVRTGFCENDIPDMDRDVLLCESAYRRVSRNE